LRREIKILNEVVDCEMMILGRRRRRRRRRKGLKKMKKRGRRCVGVLNLGNALRLLF
jgi:hypothetical protein